MANFSAADHAFMARAVRLAANGRYTAHPNPVVGCVLVHGDQIVGEGWHRKAGAAHAEVNALAAAGQDADGARAYVTLEPCAHHGKTPPCTTALIEAGVAEVIVALRDPNPQVDGRGLEVLANAGVAVRSGLLRETVASQLTGFVRRMQSGRPYVRLKMACSFDGRIAMANGESQWITGPEARADVQRLRAAAGAIVTGIGTVLADDPSLTVRDPVIDTAGRQPLRAVLDAGLRMPLSSGMLDLPGTTLVYCRNDAEREPLENAGATVVKVDGDAGAVDPVAVLNDLGAREVNDALVEAGPALAGSLVEQNLVDELVIYQAPHIMGSETMGMFDTPGWTALTDRRALRITDVRRLGADTRITARLASVD